MDGNFISQATQPQVNNEQYASVEHTAHLLHTTEQSLPKNVKIILIYSFFLVRKSIGN